MAYAALIDYVTAGHDLDEVRGTIEEHLSVPLEGGDDDSWGQPVEPSLHRAPAVGGR